MEAIKNFFKNYIAWLSVPKIGVTDIIEMLIIAFVIYHLVNWFKRTRAWTLVKGIAVLFFYGR